MRYNIITGIQNGVLRLLNWVNYDFALFSEDVMLHSIEVPQKNDPEKLPMSRS